jgi:hypothetical protein
MLSYDSCLLACKYLSVIDSMEPSPSSETKSYSANQEISSILWNQRVHCRVQKTPLVVSILCQMKPVYNLDLIFKVLYSLTTSWFS